MKKIIYLLILTFGFSLLIACQEEQIRTLRIYNWADYIDETILDDFISYFEAEYDEEIAIVYDTFETNEVMYNTLRSGKTSYDLVCPSEYMIQKMIRENMVKPFEHELLTDYFQYVSPFFQDILEKNQLDQYAIGYMWGTLGIIYNPEILADFDPNYDITTWDVFWNPLLKGTGSMKDSVRDTYAATVLKVYKDEILRLQEQFAIIDPFLDLEKTMLYNDKITEIMNRTDADTLKLVETALRELKNNIYGLEVDSGKGDIVTGKIGMNLAWSGDAVYSMDLAEEEGIDLFYSVPQEGSNIWFDGWVMPKGSDEENSDIIHEFINFISHPENAARNMEEIGYTSAIAGEDIFNLIEEWYGIRGYNYEIDELYELLDTLEEGSEEYLETLEEITELENERDEIDLTEIDLTYFFSGVESENKVIVLVDEYYIDRQFSAQYPEYEVVYRCAIMSDFKDQNEQVLQLWINFKANKAPLALIISLAGFMVGCVGLYLYSQRSVIRRRRESREAKRLNQK